MNTKTIRLAMLAALPLVGFAEGEVYEGYWESMTTGTGTYWWNAANWRDGVLRLESHKLGALQSGDLRFRVGRLQADLDQQSRVLRRRLPADDRTEPVFLAVA